MNDELKSCKEALADTLGRLARLHAAAVYLCTTLEKEYAKSSHTTTITLDESIWEALEDVALFAGCTHLSWYRAGLKNKLQV
jgi:hypothetical protein